MPLGIDGFTGVTVIDTSTAGPTVMVVLPDTPELALTWVAPCATPVARPLEVMVATLVIDEVQLTVLVRSFVLPSL